MIRSAWPNVTKSRHRFGKKSLLVVVYFSIYAFTGYTALGAVQKLERTLSAKKTVTKP